MAIRTEIIALGTVTDPGDYKKFSFRAPYPKLKGLTVYSPEGHAAKASQRAAVELALTCEDGDVNLFNDMIGLKRKHVDEKTSPLRRLDQDTGRNKIEGYAKCLENTTGAPLTLKLYLLYEDGE